MNKLLTKNRRLRTPSPSRKHQEIEIGQHHEIPSRLLDMILKKRTMKIKIIDSTFLIIIFVIIMIYHFLKIIVY